MIWLMMKKKPSMDAPPYYVEMGGGEGPAMLILAVILALLLFCMSGCAGRAIVRPDPKIATVIKSHKHAWDKETGNCLICGATYNPMIEKLRQTRRMENKLVMISAIMTESGLSEPEATILWEDYQMLKTKKINTLAKYMIDIKFSPANDGFTLRDDIFVRFVERVKIRTKILKRGGYEK